MPEWEIVQDVVRGSLAREQAAWQTFTSCRSIEVYTDGSAPVRNPGGPAGFASVIVGFEGLIDGSTPERPAPHARLDLAGYIPKRVAEPLTSNNRAELAGVLAASEALRLLGEMGCAADQAYILSDSQYVVNCANGTWQRKKNTDLWPILDRLTVEVGQRVSGDFALKWVKGHAGNQYNNAADELASRAAFNFDDELYARFRQAQAATGREMPGEWALAQEGKVSTQEPEKANVGNWQKDADYTLVLRTKLDGGGQPDIGRGSAAGTYHIWTKDGRSHEGQVSHQGEHAHDEAEYLTLISALEHILERITRAGRSPGNYTLKIYSRRELMVKQITGEYRVKAPALQYVYAQARVLLDQFKSPEVLWKRSNEIDKLFR